MSSLPWPELAPGSRKGLLHWTQQGDMATPCVMWRRVWCGAVMGRVWAANSWHGGELPYLFLPSFDYPWMPEGPLSCDNDKWGELMSAVPLRLLLWALPGLDPPCPSMSYLCILLLCQAATLPPMPCSPAKCCWHRSRWECGAGNAIKAQALLTRSHSSLSGTGLLQTL